MQKILCLILIFLAALRTIAADADFKFRRLDTRDGLSNSKPNCIFRDSRGFVWIGTPFGLNRYDGYRIRTYYSQSKDTTTLLRNYVDEIQEDANGHLWLRQGTQYAVFNPFEDTCLRHPERWLHEQGICGSIERVHIDRRKNYWVKTYDQGFWFLNLQTGEVSHFLIGQGEDFTVSDFEESGNSLLVVSNNGELICFHTKDCRVSWTSSRLRALGSPQTSGYSLHVDSQKNIWVLTDVGVYAFLRKTGRWHTSAQKAFRSLGVTDLPDNLVIWDMVSDRNGSLWLATDHEGLCIANLNGGPIYQSKSIKGNETTISDNTLRQIYCDQLGRMWIATYGNGVNCYMDNQFDFKHYNIGNVNTICVDHQGCWWAGTNDQGIIRFNQQSGECAVYNKENSGFGSDVIVSSLCASDGSLWFGTFDGGLIRYYGGNFSVMKAGGTIDSLNNNSVWAICEDRKKNIWIGTLGSGLQCIDQKTGKFSTLNMDNSSLPNNYISSIQLTSEGLLLVAHGEFYSLVNPETRTLENKRLDEHPTDNPVTASSIQAVQDSRGLIWQGSYCGATISDPKTGTTYLLDMRSGLIGSTVNGIAEDRYHAMWVVTEHGISHVVPKQLNDGRWTFLIRSFNNRDGLQEGPFNQRSVVLSPNGYMLIGGHEGIDMINPQRIVTPYTQHEIPMISGVKIMDQKVKNVGKELHLKYSENQFTLQLCSNSGEMHNRARFAYILHGLNDQWHYTEYANSDISYMGLPSGHYTLCVRMLKGDGVMGQQEIRLPIIIDSPWYRSWWMWTIYLLLTAVFVYWFYRRTKEKLKLERLKMEQENTHQFDELKKKFADMVNEELRQPFQQTFDSLNALMQNETDELRYEQQQHVFSHVESLLKEVSKLAENDLAKNKLKPQIRELEIESMDEKLVKQATAYVENNLTNADISVETMAEELGMSRVHLYKRLTAVTGLAPSEFIRQIRLRHAEQLLCKSQLTVAEVAYKVGFNNPRYLTKYFKAMYGMIPSAYKNKEKNENSGDL